MTIMPAGLCLAKGIIIEVFVLCNLCLQRDVFSHIEAVSVEQKGCQQTAHSAVAIVERVDAQKIMYKNRNHNKRFSFHISDDTIVFLADPVQRLWGLIGRKRSNECLHMTVRVSGTDIILDILGSAGHSVIHMAVQNFMGLQDIVLRDWNGIEALVDDVQHITITGDFLLIAVLGSRFLLDQLLDTGNSQFYRKK